ncbi:MarR family winged helix-turn-helix transcriptional regulator [Nocardioides zeae]
MPTPAHLPADADLDVTRLAGELVTAAGRLVRQVRRSSPQAAPTLRVLAMLDDHGPLTVGRVAELDGTSQPTATAAVRGLVGRGWVERTPHPDDARSTLLSLTPAGRTALADQRRANAVLVRDRLLAAGRHSPDDLARAVDLLRALTEGTA